MRKNRIPLVWQIMIGLVLGVIVGAALHAYPEQRSWMTANVLQPAGDIFIRLMKMIVVPIVFSCMVVGVAGQSSTAALGRVGVKTMTYFLSVTTIAIVFGLVAGNIMQPGANADMSAMHAAQVTLPANAQAGPQGFVGLIFSIIPENIIDAMAQGKLLAVIFFAIMFGIGLNQIPAEKREPVISVLRGVSDAMFKVTYMIMAYAPIGIFGMIAVTVSNFGLSALAPLAKLILVTYAAIILFGVFVLGVIARCAGVSLVKLMIYFKDELIMAFSTAASATVMPQLMQKLEKYGVPPRIVSFVVPLGYSFNLDGGSLFLGIGTLFIAQLYGIDLTLTQQIMLVLTMVLTSKGAAGVPGFVFVILSATLSSAGLPLEGIAFIAGVYRIMEMGTTTLNVLGNALAPIVIARWETRGLKIGNHSSAEPLKNS